MAIHNRSHRALWRGYLLGAAVASCLTVTAQGSAQSLQDDSSSTDADPAAATGTPQQAPHDPAKAARAAEVFHGHRWGIAVTGGYFAKTDDTWGVEIDPFTYSVGGLISYTTPVGVWIGLQGQWFAGTTQSQTIEPLAGAIYDVDAKSRAIAAGIAVGFDYPIGPVVLRHALDIGATIESYDFGDIPFYAIGYFSPMKGTNVSMYLNPGLGLMLPLGRFYLGPEVRYRIELGGGAPSALGGQLQLGVRL